MPAQPPPLHHGLQIPSMTRTHPGFGPPRQLLFRVDSTRVTSQSGVQGRYRGFPLSSKQAPPGGVGVSTPNGVHGSEMGEGQAQTGWPSMIIPVEQPFP